MEDHGAMYIYIYPLVMTNSLPWKPWPIEIDGLPINSMVIFHGYVSHNQMVGLMFSLNLLIIGLPNFDPYPCL